MAYRSWDPDARKPRTNPCRKLQIGFLVGKEYFRWKSLLV